MNRSSSRVSPITISTYYFIHAPNAKEQPNLLQSHSSPQFRSIQKKSAEIKRIEPQPQTTIDENQEQNNIYDSVVSLDLPTANGICDPMYTKCKQMFPLKYRASSI